MLTDDEVFDEILDHMGDCVNLNEDYVIWICFECGEKYGNRECGVATWHPGMCDVCHRLRSVTEPRDFGGLKKQNGLR